MQRLITRSSQVIIDLTILAAAFFGAFALRFEGDVPSGMLVRAFLMWPYVVGFQYFCLMTFGVPRFAWRYVGLRETTRIAAALAASTLGLVTFRWMAGTLASHYPRMVHAVLPMGALLIDFMLAFVAITGARALRRLQVEQRAASHARTRRSPNQIPTLLVGAGQAGLMVAKEIASWPQLGIQPVGFVDDDPLKLGIVLHGLTVLGNTSKLEQIAHKTGATQALITIASTSGQSIRRITKECQAAGLKVKIIPGIYEIVGGQVNLSRIRSVAIEDLLGREPVQLDLAAIEKVVEQRVTLVTGAAGSIGQEICRQVCRFSPAKLLLVDQAETNLFFIHQELQRDFPQLTLLPCVADICDRAYMEKLFAEHKPSTVFHAAAYKHVPMMEQTPREAIKNNVLGTRNLADLAHLCAVETFVMISTDKAVNPTSVMGASKRLAEMYVQALGAKSQTCFVAVRFGNVLGSAGSVIPIFREQVARGGPVTVTHPDMTRYFMTIPEACQLVLQAASMGSGGEIFILDMGEPVKIVDLARDLITLSGLTVGEDIDIEFCGMRPGEKLFEELSVADEDANKTRHPKIFVGRIRAHAYDEIANNVKALEQLLEASGDAESCKAALAKLVPEYSPYTVDGEPQNDAEVLASA